MFDTLYAAASNPGHSWNEIEGNENLLINISDNKVAINDLKLKGKLCDSVGNCGKEGDILEFAPSGIKWKVKLTYGESIHFEPDCTLLGGTVFDTGSGTICRVPLSDAPTGWKQAENWHRYSVSDWGGDYCNHHKATAPITFSNVAAYKPYPNGTHDCAYTGYYNCTVCESMWMTSYEPNNSNKWCYYNSWTTGPAGSENRVEIGIY
ncbi:MAG: hypothetical protein PHX22_12095 [Dysgonamonadaceae bacterium]|nr:hypothetical protein [Dysgonamonadaceae bacterium]